MELKIKSLIAVSLLAFGIDAGAQLKTQEMPAAENSIVTAGAGSTFQYFNGTFSELKGSTGIGGSAKYPLRYSAAIKLEKNNAELAGKKISSITFMFKDLSTINDITVWISTTRPDNDREADVCCIPVNKAGIAASQPYTAKLPDAYLFGSSDVYVGYSFNETDPKDYPILVDDGQNKTKPNAFFFNYGMTWLDLGGRLNGNVAIMVGLGDEQAKVTKGDVNSDGKINVLDLSATIDYIIKGYSSIVNKNAADIDGNGTVNIVDAESIVDIILEKNKAFATSDYGRDALYASLTDEGLSISHDAGMQYRGFQMDIVAADDAIQSIEADPSLSSTHDIKYTSLGNGRYRVIATSINGSCFDSGKLLDISASTEDIRIENIVFATSDLKEKRFDNICGAVTAIRSAEAAAAAGNAYSISGVKTGRSSMKKGIYIINNRKVVIR